MTDFSHPKFKTLPCGNKFGSSMFSCDNGFRLTREAILALHMVDLDDKIACVTHFSPAFADFPLPARKVVQTVDHDLARTGQYQAWLAEADTLEKTAGRGVHAPTHPQP